MRTKRETTKLDDSFVRSWPQWMKSKSDWFPSNLHRLHKAKSAKLISFPRRFPSLRILRRWARFLNIRFAILGWSKLIQCMLRFCLCKRDQYRKHSHSCSHLEFQKKSASRIMIEYIMNIVAFWISECLGTSCSWPCKTSKQLKISSKISRLALNWHTPSIRRFPELELPHKQHIMVT